MSDFAKDTNVPANDCISRQAAIDFINAGHLVNSNEPRWSDNEVVNFLKSRPSTQPEIIRCKDCRKHNVHSGYKDDCCPLYEWRGISYGHEHDYQYCSFAGRREG